MTRLFAASHALQRYGLSLVFFYFALGRARILASSDSWRALGTMIVTDPIGERALLSYEQVAMHAMLLLFNLFVGVLLLALRPPAHPPERPAHVLAPLLSTFGNLGFELGAHLPTRMHAPLVEPRPALLLLGGALMIAGYAISLAALAHLRRSFSLFVEVRARVESGPYRFVRHPMYAGYLLVVLGLVLVRASPAILVLGAMVSAITIYRARLEEEMLARHTSDYPAYRARTGLLFPRLSSTRAGTD